MSAEQPSAVRCECGIRGFFSPGEPQYPFEILESTSVYTEILKMIPDKQNKTGSSLSPNV